MNSTEYRNGYNTPELRAKIRAAVSDYRDKIAAGETVRPSISQGNRKTHIPSISLPPYITCPAVCRGTCDSKCYAGKGCSIHTSELNAYSRNFALYLDRPAEYFGAVKTACANARFFRWHVAGDIVDAAYFAGMVDVARACPGTRFLAFTKRYSLVNEWIDANGPLPLNLQLMFSGWSNLTPDNPHGLPETTVYGKKEEPAAEWLLCGGNCLECACRGVGCWQTKPGETLAFELH